MSEENDGQQAEEFKPITSQDELNKLIGARINSVKSQYADYDDLKAKAAKFDDAEQANKSELQKAQDAARAAEDRALKAEGTALRAQVAANKGVPATALTGSTKEELEAAADALLSWRGEKPAAGAKPDPKKLQSGSRGNGDNTAGLTGKERAAELLKQYRASSH